MVQNPSTPFGLWAERSLPVNRARLTDNFEHFPAEPRWLTDDQDKAIAWQLDEADKCPGCGTRSYEKVKVSSIVCTTCRDVTLAQRDDGFKRTPGKHIVLRRSDGESS